MSRYSFLQSSRTEVVAQYLSNDTRRLDILKDFIENTYGEPYLTFAPWTEEHFRKIRAYPHILNDYVALTLPSDYDLVLGYAVWCERNQIQIHYKDSDGVRILRSDIESFIENRKSRSRSADTCINDGALISALVILLTPVSEISGDLDKVDCTYVFPTYAPNVAFKAINYDDSFLDLAVKYGKLEFVAYGVRIGLPYDESILVLALSEERFEIVEYLITETDLSLSPDLYIEIAKNSTLTINTIRYLHEQRGIVIPVILIRLLIDQAFQTGKVDVLPYIFNNCVYETDAKQYVNDLEIENRWDRDKIVHVINFLLMYGFEWRNGDVQFFLNALRTGEGEYYGFSPIQEEDLKALIGLGCPFQHEHVIMCAMSYKSPDFVRFLIGRGLNIRLEIFIELLKRKMYHEVPMQEYASLFKDIGGQSFDFIFQRANLFDVKYATNHQRLIEHGLKFIKYAIEIGVQYDINNLNDSLKKHINCLTNDQKTTPGLSTIDKIMIDKIKQKIVHMLQNFSP
jgi:hypothetical protein